MLRFIVGLYVGAAVAVAQLVFLGRATPANPPQAVACELKMDAE